MMRDQIGFSRRAVFGAVFGTVAVLFFLSPQCVRSQSHSTQRAQRQIPSTPEVDAWLEKIRKVAESGESEQIEDVIRSAFSDGYNHDGQHRFILMVQVGDVLIQAGAYEAAVNYYLRLLDASELRETDAEPTGVQLQVESWIELVHRLGLSRAYQELGYKDLAAFELETAARLAERSGQTELEEVFDFFVRVYRMSAEDLDDPVGYFESLDGQVTDEGVGSLAETLDSLVRWGEELGEKLDGTPTFDGIVGTLVDYLEKADGNGIAIDDYEGVIDLFTNLERNVEEQGVVQVVEELERALSALPNETSLWYRSASRDLQFGHVLWRAGEHGQALLRVRRALELLEDHTRGKWSDPALLASMEKASLQFLPIAIDVLASLEPREALARVERNRARVLRRRLGIPRPSGGGSCELDFTPGAQRQELSAVERRFEAATGTDEIRGLSELLSERRRTFADDRTRCHLAMGQSQVRGVDDEPVSVEEVLSSSIDEDSTILVFFRGREYLWIWAAFRESGGEDSGHRVEAVGVPIDDEQWQEIACLARLLRWQGTPPEAQERAGDRGVHPVRSCGSGAVTDPAERLHELLIAPVRDLLGSRSKLVLVPQGQLHAVPFAALRDRESGKYLVQDFVIATSPSLSALARFDLGHAPSGPPEVALVLGDPATDSSLPALFGARLEAKRIAEILGTTALTGTEATEAAVRELGPELGVLHLAAHGTLVEEPSIFSRIELAAGGGHDGALEVHEIWDQLDLGLARLVTISGCETGLGERTHGDDLIGLTQSLLIAGSRTVIGTLWPIDDSRGTPQLMASFYEHWVAGLPVAEALRAAQLRMLETPSYQYPYYWAGFTLVGSPETRYTVQPQ